MKKIISLILAIFIFATMTVFTVGAEDGDVPTEVQTTVMGETVIVSWEPIIGASGYYIDVTYTETGFEGDDHQIFRTSEPSYTFEEVKEGQSVYFRILSDFGKASAPSEIFSYHAPVTVPYVRFRTENLIALTYDEGFEYSMDQSSWQKINVFTGLSEFTEYSFYRRSIYGNGISEPCIAKTLCSHSSTHEDTTPATCDSEGLIKYVCDICGETVSTEAVPRKEHTLQEIAGTYVAPTETTAGRRSYLCLDCGAKIEKTVEGAIDCEHTETVRRVTRDTTCEHAGTAEIYCALCGYLISTEEIEKLPHSEGKEEVISKPTCITKGIIRTFCYVCGGIVTETELDYTDHAYTDYYTDSYDRSVRHCMDCGFLDTVSALPKTSAESGGVTAMISGGLEFSDNLVFRAEDITSNAGDYISNYDSAVSRINSDRKNNGIATLYRLSVTAYDGADLSGSVISIKIPVSRFTGEDFVIYKISEDGSVTACGSAVKDGSIVFVMEENSAYAVVDVTGLNKKTNKFKVIIAAVLISIIVLLAGAGVVGYYMYSKVRKQKSKEWLDDNPNMNGNA